jgi:tetratricopeptide (TPR) repeat protein
MKVYLSSTLKDLQNERNAVRKALEGECVVVDSYSASDSAVVESCLADVERCDVYVGIIGFRYGETPRGYEKSITHLEYDRATACDLRRFIFLKTPEAIPPMHSDVGTVEQASTRIEAFRAHLSKSDADGTRVAFFGTVEDLVIALSKSVGPYLHRATGGITIPRAQADVFNDYLRAVTDYCSLAPHVISDHANTLTYVEPDVQQDVQQRTLNPMPGGEIRTSLSNVIRALEREGRGVWSLLVKGEPGSGKSTLLRQLAAQAWDAPVKAGLLSRRLPLVIRLRWFAATTGGFSERCRAALLEERFPVSEQLPPDFLKAWSRRYSARWIILLDGIDEVLDTHSWRLHAELIEFRRFCRAEGHCVVFSTRPNAPAYVELAREMPAVTVQAFDDLQRQDFLGRFLGPLAGQFSQDFSRANLGSLAGSPLFLTMSASLYKQPSTRRVPSNPAQLYEQYLLQWMEEAARRSQTGGTTLPSPRTLFDTLGDVALRLTERPELATVPAVAQMLEARSSPAQARHTLDVFARVSGILAIRGETLEWQHRSFREYLAARALAATMAPSDPRAWRIVARWSEETWRQVVLFLFTLWQERDGVSRLLSRLSHQSTEALQLAVEAIADGAPAVVEVENTLVRRVAGQTRSATMNASCATLLFKAPPPIRILGKLRAREEIANELVRLAVHPMHFDVLASEAIDALVKLGRVAALEPHLRDPHISELRQARLHLAIAAAGRVARVRAQLRDFAKSRTLDVDARVQCACAIGRGEDRAWVRSILSSLVTEAGARSAVKALVDLGAHEVLLSVCPQVVSLGADVALAVLDGLVRLDWREEYAAVFLELANHADVPENVAAEAARCIGRWGTREQLISVLGGGARRVGIAKLLFETAAEALKDDAVQPHVMALCLDETASPRIRSHAADVLGDPELQLRLHAALAGDTQVDEDIRIDAATRLFRAGHRDEAEDLLNAIILKASHMRFAIRGARALIDEAAETSARPHLQRIAQELLDKPSGGLADWAGDLGLLLQHVGDTRLAVALFEAAALYADRKDTFIEPLFSLGERAALERILASAEAPGNSVSSSARALLRLGAPKPVADVALNPARSTTHRWEVLKALATGRPNIDVARAMGGLVMDETLDSSLREAAMGAWTTALGDEAKDALILAFESAALDFTARLWIAEGLAALDVEQPALPWLRTVASEDDRPSEIRLRACEGLLRAGWEEMVAAQLRALAERRPATADDRTPIQAAILLHSIGDIDTAETCLLAYARRDAQSHDARREAVEALVEIGRLDDCGPLLWKIAAGLEGRSQVRFIRAMWLAGSPTHALERVQQVLHWRRAPFGERVLALHIVSMLPDAADKYDNPLLDVAGDDADSAAVRLAAARFYLEANEDADPAEFAPLLTAAGGRVSDLKTLAKAMKKHGQTELLLKVLRGPGVSCAIRLAIAGEIECAAITSWTYDSVAKDVIATADQIVTALDCLYFEPAPDSLVTVRHLLTHADERVRSRAREIASSVERDLAEDVYYTIWRLAEEATGVNLAAPVSSGRLRYLKVMHAVSQWTWNSGDPRADLQTLIAENPALRPLLLAIRAHYEERERSFTEALTTLAEGLELFGIDVSRRPIHLKGTEPDLVGVMLVQVAEAARLSEHFELARAANDAAVIVRPTARAFTERALLRSAMDDDTDALEDIDRAISLNPSWEFPRRQRAQWRRWAGAPEAALTDIEVVLKDTSYPSLEDLLERGRIRRDLKDYEGALTDFRNAVRSSRSDGAVWAELGLTLRLLERYDEALKDYAVALRLQPDDSYIWAASGETNRLMERFSDAFEAFTRALALNPESTFALSGRGQTLRTLGRDDDAIRDFAEAVRLDPQDEASFGWLGDLLHRTERYEEAIAALDSALALDPDDKWDLASRADSARMLGQLERALEDAGRALRLDEQFTYARSIRGAVLLELMELADAQRELERAREEDPEDAWTLGILANLYCGLLAFDRAEGEVSKAIDIDPQPWMFSRRAVVHLWLGNVPRARTDIDQALATSSDDEDVAYTSALVSHVEGNQEEAHRSAAGAIDMARRSMSTSANSRPEVTLVTALTLCARIDEARAVVHAAATDPVRSRHLPRLVAELQEQFRFTGNTKVADLAGEVSDRIGLLLVHAPEVPNSAANALRQASLRSVSHGSGSPSAR